MRPDLDQGIFGIRWSKEKEWLKGVAEAQKKLTESDAYYVPTPHYADEGEESEPDCSAICNPEFSAAQLDIIVKLIHNQLNDVTQLQKQLYTILAKAEIQAEIKREKEMDDGCN